MNSPETAHTLSSRRAGWGGWCKIKEGRDVAFLVARVTSLCRRQRGRVSVNDVPVRRDALAPRRSPSPPPRADLVHLKRTRGTPDTNDPRVSRSAEERWQGGDTLTVQVPKKKLFDEAETHTLACTYTHTCRHAHTRGHMHAYTHIHTHTQRRSGYNKRGGERRKKLEICMLLSQANPRRLLVRFGEVRSAVVERHRAVGNDG